MDSFGIPWAPVMGNHDNQCDALVPQITELFENCGTCLFEAGDATLGCGNYTIGINCGGEPISALIMMDTHDREGGGDSGIKFTWGYLTPEQNEWYRAEALRLKNEGYADSTLFVHIPPHIYRPISEQVFTGDTNESDSVYIDCPDEFVKDKDAFRFGVNYEVPSCPSHDDGVLDTIVETGHTKSVICGHNHINSSSLMYRGVCLTYSLKLGCISYSKRHLNGGTVVRITDSGACLPEHVYVDVSHLAN